MMPPVRLLRASVCLFVSLVPLSGRASAQMANLWFDPAVISSCTPDGFGSAALFWTAPITGLVQVRVLGAAGPPMTGWERSTGRGETGDWVRDGMLFALVDERGTPLATARARVRCGSYATEAPAQLPAGGYLPLQIGNRWVYRLNSRQFTAEYQSLQVERTDVIDGQTWYVIAVTNSVSGAFEQPPPAASYLWRRTTEDGRIYVLEEQPDGSRREQLWLDPAVPPDPTALLTVNGRNIPLRHALGNFTGTLAALRFSGLGGETIRFARGVGIVERTLTMISGSSGGLIESRELVYAKLGERLLLASPAAGISLDVENTSPNVSAREVNNCAVPCYFVACGLAGADPPDTYKPCMQTRIRIEEPALLGSDPAATVRVLLDFQNGAGQSMYRNEQDIPARLIGQAWTLYHRLPLYSQPSQPLPAGAYHLNATAMFPDNKTQTVTVSVDLR